MRMDNNVMPKSSFLSVQKDLDIIVNKILSNQNLKKLLYYTTEDSLEKPTLTPEQSISLFGDQIKIVPKIIVEEESKNYLMISFDNFIESENPEFRDNVIIFDIICHYNNWQLQNMELRPYRIAGELDAMFNDTYLSGFGKIKFMGASKFIANDEFSGVTLMYETVHGGEDKYDPLGG